MSARVTAQMVARQRNLADPRWSPDGRWLAWVESFGGRADVVVAPADGSGPAITLTVDAGVARAGSPFAWTPDSAEIIHAAADGRLVAVPTYTAMLELRELLASRGVVRGQFT
ncbi:MAG: hypothetical protein M3357_05920 [Actinomycetota bacterium]|nr:hypothetical protein [Actinomycetota bacterium]